MYNNLQDEGSLEHMRDFTSIRTLLNNGFLIDKAGIAKLIGITQSGVSDMINRYNKRDHDDKLRFPDPISFCDKTYYISEEVQQWLTKYGKVVKNGTVVTYGKKKSICLSGQPGTGKSLFWTLFVAIDLLLREIVSKAGSACTQSLTYITISSDITDNYVRIVSENKDFEPGFIIVNEENKNRIKGILNSYNEYIKQLDKDYDLEKEYIEFYLKPSDKCKNILSKLDVSQLQFFDTPGIDDKHHGEALINADMLLVFLGNRGNIKEIVDVIKPIVPYALASKMQYIYNSSNRLIANQADYDSLENELKTVMNDYKDELSELQKDSIIMNSAAIFEPENNFLVLPQITSEATPPAFREMLKPGEELFTDKACDSIIRTFNNTPLESTLENISPEEFNSCKDTFTKLIRNYIQELNDHFLVNKSSSKYTKETFTKIKHGRTKDADNYKVVSSLYHLRQSALLFLYNKFLQYQQCDYDQTNKKIIILAYTLLAEALKGNYKLGYGIHPFEDFLCETQMIEESICANDIILADPELTDTSIYAKTLSDNNIFSASWNFVYLNRTIYAKDKLHIIKEYSLYKYSAETLEGLICATHINATIALLYLRTILKINNKDVESLSYNDRKQFYDEVMK
ncbi:hypothetical protein [Clostridium perfringens]|uniref:hypothetical protein n=1 Tax=Clostridium perfringens TaxID=1502 RepID=UPI001CB59F88|nr:hypothetical protein [Clostridium perfringens]EJT5929273.1 hypothetical protein [Clostridium perfringens]EJT6484045.1 hypothetical protein [Clostridium perfringens]MDK0584180.1 hypothetical protein [Clostridium perfringens]HBI6967673.1 hypothetical protein [Clostridium perfringens]